MITTAALDPTPIPATETAKDILVHDVVAHMYGGAVRGEVCSRMFTDTVCACLDAALRAAGHAGVADQVEAFLRRDTGYPPPGPSVGVVSCGR